MYASCNRNYARGNFFLVCYPLANCGVGQPIGFCLNFSDLLVYLREQLSQKCSVSVLSSTKRTLTMPCFLCLRPYSTLDHGHTVDHGRRSWSGQPYTLVIREELPRTEFRGAREHKIFLSFTCVDFVGKENCVPCAGKGRCGNGFASEIRLRWVGLCREFVLGSTTQDSHASGVRTSNRPHFHHLWTYLVYSATAH